MCGIAGDLGARASRPGIAILFLAWAGFCASFFLPAYNIGDLTLSGWESLKALLSSRNTFEFISGLSNLVMPLSVHAAWKGMPSLRTTLFLMVSSLLINAWWFLDHAQYREDLRMGYYLWVASFLFAAAGLFVVSSKGSPAPVES